MRELTLHLPDASATEAVGRCIAGALAPGMVVTLSGELGAGKTTLVRGLLREMGWTGRVKSPTFTLVEHYPLSNLYLYHFDFYRFDDAEGGAADWDGAGVADAFRDDTVCVVEWPERVAALLPPADLALSLTSDEARDGRRLLARAATPLGEACLSALAAG